MTEQKRNEIFASLLELNNEIHKDEVIATNNNDFEKLEQYRILRHNISELLSYLEN